MKRVKPKRKKCFLLAVVFLLSACAASALERGEDNALLMELIREALENNPMLEAAASRFLAAEKAVPQAGALPDPQLSFGLVNLPLNSFSFTQEPMTGKVVTAMQMFPFPGKLALKTGMAELEASAVRHQKDEVRNQVVYRVKNLYFSLYAIDRALETVEKNKGLLGQLIQVAEAKYSTGTGLQQDVLRAQVELSKLEDDSIMWQQKRLAAEARLNALLNRPAGSPVPKISRELFLPPEESMDVSEDTVERTRPLLKAWKERIRKAESAVALALRDFWPNFTVGTSYNQRNDLKNGAKMYDFVSATVSLNVPLYFKRKQKMKVAEKELDLAAVKADYENVRTEILAELQSQKAELDRHRKRIELYKGGILLQARQSLDSALAGYRVGKVDFLTLISNWMMLQNYELQYFFACSDYHKSLASYDLTMGKEHSLAENQKTQGLDEIKTKGRLE